MYSVQCIWLCLCAAGFHRWILLSAGHNQDCAIHRCQCNTQVNYSFYGQFGLPVFWPCWVLLEANLVTFSFESLACLHAVCNCCATVTYCCRQATLAKLAGRQRWQRCQSAELVRLLSTLAGLPITVIAAQSLRQLAI